MANGADARASAADTRSLDPLTELFSNIHTVFGRIDTVIAGAGIDRIASLEQQSETDSTALIDINLIGVWRALTAALPYAQRSPSCRGSSIPSR